MLVLVGLDEAIASRECRASCAHQQRPNATDLRVGRGPAEPWKYRAVRIFAMP